MTKLSITGTSTTPSCDLVGDEWAAEARPVIDARVACSPKKLDVAVLSAVAEADRITGARSIVGTGRSFEPSYPRPVHRLQADRRAVLGRSAR